jgi:tetratricopeptide (TPR) repeat protein
LSGYSSLTSLCEGDLERRVGELRRSAQLLGELGPSPTWWVRTGIELARCGEIAAAEEALRSIEEQMDPENDAHQAGLLRLQAELAVINGDIAGAIRLLDAAGLKYESPETREGIAAAYVQSGSSEEAEAALRTFIEDPSPPLGWEPQVRWQEAHVLLAAMYIDREQVELAIPLLDFILECWSEADADFDLAIEARELRGRI